MSRARRALATAATAAVIAFPLTACGGGYQCDDAAGSDVMVTADDDCGEDDD